MREFIDFSDNFKPEGKIKVELFDDLTGRKIEEIETNNFIAKGVNYYFRIALIDLFTKDKSINSIEHYLPSLIGRMILTNASHPEQPEKEWYVKGEEIGFADTEFYDEAIERSGMYNDFESFTTHEQVHIVMDFPTHAANGSFQSIYFAPMYGSQNYGIFRPFELEGLPGVLKVQKYNNEIWVLHSTEETGYYYSGEISNVLSRYDLDFNLIQTYELPYEKLDFCIHNNYIYFTEDESERGLQRAPLSDPTNLTTIIDELINGNERLIGIVFDHKNNQFVISSAYDSDIKSISRFDTNFNILSNTPFDLLTYSYLDYYSSRNLKLFINNDGDIFVNSEDYSCILQNDRIGGSAEIGLAVGVIDNYKVMRNGEVMPQIGISSRALLDAPVTKTSSTTMKITYDFMLPEFHWWRI